MIFLKRAYEHADSDGGLRFLVDRLWPRGVDKKWLNVEEWIKEVAPSAELRSWFNHDPKKWKQFKHRYFTELEKKPEAWKPLVEAAKKCDVTFVYAARDTEHNNAVALKEYVMKQLRRKRRPTLPTD